MLGASSHAQPIRRGGADAVSPSGQGGGATAPGCVSSPTSALGALICSMDPGEIQELTGSSNLFTSLQSVGNTGNILSFTINGVWDAPRGQATIIAQDHGQEPPCDDDVGAPCLREVRYTESTNAWSIVDADIGIVGHGYNHTTVDDAGTLYHIAYDSGTISRKQLNGSWQLNWATGIEFNNITFGSVFWSGALKGNDGGQGAMVWYDIAFGQILGLDVGKGDFPVSLNGIHPGPTCTSPHPCAYQQLCAYNPVVNYMVCGGNNDNTDGTSGKIDGLFPTRRYFRVESDLDVVVLDEAPIGAKIGVNIGALMPAPGRNYFLVLNSGNLYRVDAGGTGTWTLLTSFTQPASMNSPSGTSDTMVYVPLWNYEALMFVSSDNGTDANVHDYVPPEN